LSTASAFVALRYMLAVIDVGEIVD